MEIKREHHINFWYIILTLLAVMLIQDFMVQATQTKTIAYSEFQQLLDQGGVSDIVVGPTTITGTLKDTKPDEPKKFTTYRVPLELANKLTAAKLSFSGESAARPARYDPRLDRALARLSATVDLHDPADDRPRRHGRKSAA